MNKTIAILGATGAVGQMMIQVLSELQLPHVSLKLFASSKSVGKQVPYLGQNLIIEEFNQQALKGVDIVLGAISSEMSKEVAPMIKAANALYIDNSSAFRLDKDVPLIVPEVNAQAAVAHQGIIANPNCSTILVATALAPLFKHYPITSIIAATYQAVSGAGQAGLDELLQQTNAIANELPLKVEVFDQPILFNVIPVIGELLESGYSSEEMKMQDELRKITENHDLKVSTTCVRVPVMQSHSIACSIDSAIKMEPDQIIKLLQSGENIKLMQDGYPTPLQASNQDQVLIGRVRQDVVFEDGISLFISGDQLRKGAATNAIQIAQLFL